MLEKAFQRLLLAINKGKHSPQLMKSAWKIWYQIFAYIWRDANWTFMNYGWLPPADAPPFPLAPEDERDRYFVGLYYYLSSFLTIEGAGVLEVGSGRGGGASWLARNRLPTQMKGIDFSPAAVALARKIHKNTPNLSFTVGDAEHIPFPDASFDAVINVESSHCYGDMAQFVSEVARVLKQGGRFGWVDIRGNGMMEATKHAFEHPNLKVIREEDITDAVLRALDKSHDRKAALIALMPFGQKLMHQVSATQGTAIYESMRQGSTRYLLKVFEKITLS